MFFTWSSVTVDWAGEVSQLTLIKSWTVSEQETPVHHGIKAEPLAARSILALLEAIFWSGAVNLNGWQTLKLRWFSSVNSIEKALCRQIQEINSYKELVRRNGWPSPISWYSLGNFAPIQNAMSFNEEKMVYTKRQDTWACCRNLEFQHCMGSSLV